jgi:hypothetical protein
MANAMPPPSSDAVLAEIDKLAGALPCPWQRRRLAILRAQVAQLVREAWVTRAESERESVLFP